MTVDERRVLLAAATGLAKKIDDAPPQIDLKAHNEEFDRREREAEDKRMQDRIAYLNK